jgi:hypothetical protein
VERIIADAPARAEWRGFLSHNARYACDLCWLPKVPVPRLKGEKKAKRFWTRATQHRPEDLRTQAVVESILPQLQGLEGDVLRETAKGVKERAAIMDFPGLNVIDSIVCEPMHVVNEGVQKKILQLLFPSTMLKGQKLPKVPATVEAGAAAQMNAQLERVKVVGQFRRRPRWLDSSWKAVEYRNLYLFYFKCLLDVLAEDSHEERAVELLVYLCRAYSLPTDEYEDQHRYHLLKRNHREFYRLYQSAFGMRHCTYNTHLFASHGLKIRERHGPYFECSAFPSEVRPPFAAPSLYTIRNNDRRRKRALYM